jgi:hypothetical protein
MTNNRNDVSQNAKTASRGLIAHLRAAAGLDKPARESMSNLEGRQMLAAATITGTLANQNVTDNDTLTPFGAVTVGDVDSSILSVEVQIDNTARGTFTSGSVTTSGFINEGSGRYTFFGSPSEVTTGLRALVYNPTDNRVPVNFSETTRFTLTVDDATDIVTDSTTTVRSISANDAPSVGSFTTSTTINDTATTSPFSSITVTDPDPFQTLSAVITLDSSAKGEFTSGSLTSSGFTAAGGGIYAFSGRVAAVQTALRALVFQPAANRVAVSSTEVTTFTVQVSDNVASPQVDSTTQVTSTSVNNAPSISGSVASQAAFDNATVQPFTALTFTDVDPSQTLTATVTLDTAAKGAFTGGSLTDSGFTHSGGGVYTRTGSVSQLTTAIRALVFAPTENRVAVGSTETTTFTVDINDGVASTVSDTTTTVVTAAFNNATTITGASASQAVNDNATASVFSSLTIGDDDSPEQTLTITIQISDSGAGGAFTNPSLSTAGFTNSGGGSYTRTGTASALTTAVQALVFSPVENDIAIGSTRNVSFAISVTDGLLSAVVNSDSSAVVTPVNDALVITGASASQPVNDNATLSPFSALTFSDVDLPGQTFTLTIALDTAAKGEFTSASLSANGFTSPSAGTYTRTGTPSQLQTAIRALVYNPSDNRVAVNSTETTTFTVTMADGLLADVVNSTTTVVSTSVNVAPTIGGVSAGQTVLDNTTILPFANVTIGDEDNNTLDVTVTIDLAAKGEFTSASLTASGFVDAGSGVYTFTGSASAAQAAIRQLAFDPTDNRIAVTSTETSTFAISVDDSIASAVTNTTTTVITTPFNDPTGITGVASAQAVNDDTAVSLFSSVTIADVDGVGQSLVLSVSFVNDGAYSGQQFTSASVSAAGFTQISDSLVEMTGTAAQLTTAIRQLQYDANDTGGAIGTTRNLSFRILVQDAAAVETENTATSAVITPVNDASSIGGASSGQAVNDNATVSPFSSVTFTDADSPAQTLTLTVTLDAAAKGEFTGASLTTAGFTSPSAGTYTRTGTAAELQTAARALVFNPTDNRVAVASTETTTFTLTLADGLLTDVTNSTTTVVSTSANDAPTISDATASQPVNDNATLLPFSGLTIADADPSQSQSVTVTLDTAAKGTFTSGSLTTSGFTDAGGGSYTFSGTAAAATTAIRQLVFQPTANRVAVGSTETVTFTVATEDGVASAVTNNTTSVVSTSINNNPTVSGASAGQAVNDNATLQPFSGVTIADVDVSSTVTVIVSIDVAAKGVFTSASLNSSGFSNAGGGSYTFTGTASAATTAIRALVFDPTNDRVAVSSTETSTFTVQVTDNSSGTVSNATTTVVSTAINDAPTITGAVVGQTTNENVNISPFSGVTIGDADTTQTLQVTITQDAAAKGTFTSASLTTAGFTDAGGGVYTRTGTASALTTAIRQLSFNPTDNRANIGATETTQFTLAVDDSVATVTNDSTTTIISTGVNDTPTVTGVATNQPVNDDATIQPFSTVSIIDGDLEGQTISIAIFLDSSAKGAFTGGSLSAAGFSDAGGGSYTRTGTASALTTAIRQLVFQPTANRVAVGSTETTGFGLEFTDGVASGTNYDTEVVSTSIDTATSISGTAASQAVNDNGTLSIFSAVTFTDPDPAAVLDIEIQGDYDKGGFTSASLTAAGFTVAGSDRWTRTGLTPAQATTAIRQLSYQPVNNFQNVGTTYTDWISVRAVSNSITYNDSATSAEITSVNDAPVISDAAPSNVNDNSTSTPFSALTIADGDNGGVQSLTIQVTLSNDTHGAFTSASLSASGFTDAGSGTYTFTGTGSAATTAIRQLVFQPIANDINIGSTRNTTFTVTATDPSSEVATSNATVVTVTPVNDVTSIGGTVGNQTVNDNASLLPFTGVTISDSDGSTQSLTINVSLDVAAKGAFSGASLSASGFTDAGFGVYTFTGTASAAQAAIRQLVFQPTANRAAVGGTETTGFTITSDDGLLSTVSDTTATAIATSIDDATTITGAVSAQALNDNQTLAIFSNITIADVDAGETLNITIYGNYDNGGFTPASLTASGFAIANFDNWILNGVTPAQATTAIRQLMYQPVANTRSVGTAYSDEFMIRANAHGIDYNNTDTSAAITSVNDAPTISGTEADQPVNDIGQNFPFNNVTLADADLSQSIFVGVALSNPTNGEFTSASLSASGFTDAGSGLYTFSGSASAATDAIRQLVFQPAANRVEVGSTQTTTFTIGVSDNIASVVSDDVTTVVSLSINDDPTISGTVADQAVNDDETLAPFAAVTIADADPDQSQQVTVSLSNQENGTFTSESLSTSGFISLGNGVYGFMGTAAAATTAIRQLVFQPTANRVSVGATQTTTFTISTNDDVASTVSDTTATAISTSINDAPSLGGVGVGQTTNDNVSINPFSAFTITDADPDQELSVSIIYSATGNGTWSSQSLTQTGFTVSGIYIVNSGTAAEMQAALRGLTFVPTQNQVNVGSTRTSSFVVTVNDGVASQVMNTATTVITTSVNDAPTISNVSSGQSVNDNATILPFTDVTIGDVDLNQNQNVSITLDSAAKGAFTSASLTASGFTSAGSGVYTFTGSATAATTAIRQLVFQPTANRTTVGSSETATFTITTTDPLSATVTNANTTAQIVSINNAPTVSNLSVGQAFNDTATFQPFSGVTIADVDPSQNVSVFVQQWATTGGTFSQESLTSSGFTQLSVGNFRFTGTAAAATTAIRSLTFVPVTNRVAVGSSDVSTFSVIAYDAVGASAGGTASIAALSVNDTPTLTSLNNATITDSASVNPFAALTFGDVDPGQQMTIFVQQWATTGGTFSSGSLASSGFTQLSAGNFRFTGTAAAATTAARALQFVPVANRVAVGSTDVSTFSVIAYDATGASVGGVSNVTATSVNDAPTVSALPTALAASDAATTQPFADVTIADVDAGESLTVFVSEWSSTPGSFSSASLSNNGFETVASGVHRVTGTATAVTTALRGLTYVPTANQLTPGQVTGANFSISVYDASAASTGGTASIAITSTNDAPTIGGIVNIGSIFDTATGSPFANTTISDVDVNASITVTITVDNAAKGAFSASSLVSSGFAASGEGTYTFTGSPAAATSAIRVLTFTPTFNRLTGGQSEGVIFNVSISDGIAPTVSNGEGGLTAVGVNEVPTIGSVTASLPALRIGQTITFTATGASDADGTVTGVQFWRDSNASGQVEETDELLVTDTTGSDGYTATVTVGSAWAATTTLLARTIDSDNAASAPASVNVSTSANTGALVATLRSNVSSATNRQSITLTATGAAASAGTLRSVTFYNDTNNNGQYDTTDRSIVTDSTSSNGYTATVTIDPTWTAGQRAFFARATDSAGLGAPATFLFTVAPNNAPIASGIGTNVTTLPSNNRVTLTLNGASDSDGSISRVDYFADVNGNGVFDAGDRRLGSSTSNGSLFSYNATLNRAWISNGSIRLFAQAFDNNSLASSVITTTIAA